MARQYQTVNVVSFVKGLFTEASPLTFPEQTAIDLDNFKLNRDGSLQRRLGIEYDVAEPISLNNIDTLNNTFEWEAPDGTPNLKFLVIQDGQYIKIFDTAAANLQQGYKGQVRVEDSVDGTYNNFSFATVNGILIIAIGKSYVIAVDYDGGKFNVQKKDILVRDVFGIDDGLVVDKRPKEITDSHLYNLRNQTWAIVRRTPDRFGFTREDPIKFFYEDEALAYPSNADNVNSALFEDLDSGHDKKTKRFYATEVFDNPLGTMEAPRGRYIIPLLDRSGGRIAGIKEDETQSLDGRHTYLKVGSIPTDKTLGGATCAASFAGRAWYGGFNGKLVGGDDNSPRLSNYVCYSKLVDKPSDSNKCYAEADPTSSEVNESIATDGGFVKIDGAGTIINMHVVGSSLIVMANNGIWEVAGGSDYGFDAQNHKVTKLGERGPVGYYSVVSTDNALFMWSESGIFTIARNEFGDTSATSITINTINKFYANIPNEDKLTCVGKYDSFEQVIRWVYGGNKELIYDLNLQAFYKYTYAGSNIVKSLFEVPPYRNLQEQEDVTVSGVQVTVDNSVVTVRLNKRTDSFKEVKYITLDSSNKLRFASLSNTEFKDWGTTDAYAFIYTGYVSAGDFQRKKDIPYLTLMFKQTEFQFDSDYVLLNQSSCKVRATWNWSDSVTSGRWGREFQGYRLLRSYMPTGQDFDNGLEVVSTKNRIRGLGKVLSLHFRTEPTKDCHILGWSFLMGVAGNV